MTMPEKRVFEATCQLDRSGPLTREVAVELIEKSAARQGVRIVNYTETPIDGSILLIAQGHKL